MLGFGLAMDAFSVSLANGLNEPRMSKNKAVGIAGVFAVFQGIMPLIGWLLVTKLRSLFDVIEGYIPSSLAVRCSTRAPGLANAKTRYRPADVKRASLSQL